MLVGLALIVYGVLFIMLRLYRHNPLQGAVSESSPAFVLFFAALDWKRNGFPLIVIVIGMVIVIVEVFN
jgi:membrane-bound ClpP family serine protease